MTPTRASRGALLVISISRSETAEWVDAEFRADFLRDAARLARAKGRRYFEVYGADGKRLSVGEVAL
jgi:hypothetical protein